MVPRKRWKPCPLKPPDHVAIDLLELVGGVAGAKVVAPAAQDRIQRRDHVADIDSEPIAAAAGRGCAAHRNIAKSRRRPAHHDNGPRGRSMPSITAARGG
jgi:hypothetical protein